MAVEFKTEHKRRTIYLFDPADLIIKPELNGRQDAPDVEPLIADILLRGQLQPVLVRNEAAKPVLVAGFSRWRAISEINRRKATDKPLPIQCVYFRGDEREGFIANLAENLQRNATTPLDDAHNCRKLEAWGIPVADIAVALRQSEAWVRGRLKLAEATPELKAAVHDGRVKATAAITIAKLAADQQRSIVKGNGTVKASASNKLGAKDLRTRIIDTWGDTTQPKAVREFCHAIVLEWWPKAAQESEQSK